VLFLSFHAFIILVDYLGKLLTSLSAPEIAYESIIESAGLLNRQDGEHYGEDQGVCAGIIAVDD
jgi:hypothetical protein